MRILAIMGSHRLQKNTDKALNLLLSTIKQQHKDINIEKIELLKMNISPCKACNYCSKHYGECIINDDMKDLYIKLKEADIIIFATPVYFNGVSTIMKIMIDRLQMVFECDKTFNKPYITKNKIGFIISIAGANEYPSQFIGHKIVFDIVNRYLKINLIEHYKLSNTDNINFEDRLETTTQLFCKKAHDKSIFSSVGCNDRT